MDVLMIADRPQCDLCGSDMRHWLDICGDYRRPEHGARFRRYWCAADKFGKVFPRPTPEDVNKFYELESYYTHHTPTAVGDPRGQNGNGRSTWGFLARLRQHMAWRLDQGSDFGIEFLRALVAGGATSLLAIGCGAGGRLKHARDAGFRLIEGIEPDPVAREIATSHGFQIYAGTAEEPPVEIRSKSYDVILLMHVLEHTLDPLKALGSARAMLKPNGSIIVETPNNQAIGRHLAGNSWPWLDVPRHLNFFSAMSLETILQQAGLAIEKTDYCGYTRQFSKQWLDTELEISKFTSCDADHRHCTTSIRNDLRAWALLALTSLAPAGRKYDSVRIVAKNGN
jgi:2-polyprenyl-3-methyl-5-hydroxy-6-metoxy-1,4-benzoquinol methylase